MQKTHFQTIEKEAVAEYKDRGSRFLAYAFPVTDVSVFKKRLTELKKEHSKAVHHCYAYRFGHQGIDFRVNDDGEPSGSAGRPILAQIDSKELTDTAVVVVRYFGGTLLGVPGLIQAYKTSTVLALQLIPVVRKTIDDTLEVFFDYTLINEVMRILKANNCVIAEKDLQLFSRVKFTVPAIRSKEVSLQLCELRNVEVKYFQK
jgi:uncharacterized YigZ family protein